MTGEGRIPVLKLGGFLLVSIQVDMHDATALALQEDLAAKIVEHGTKGVLIDISALDLVDSYIGRTLADIAAVGRVLAAATVVVGMRPAVAITLVELGLELDGVQTALTMERGMELLTTTAAPIAEAPGTETSDDELGRG